MKKRFEVPMDTYNVTYSDNSRNSYTVEVQISSYTKPEDIQYAIKCEVELKSGKETFIEVSLPSDTEQMSIKTYIETEVANSVGDVKTIVAFRKK